MMLNKVVSDTIIRLNDLPSKMLGRNTLLVGGFDIKVYVLPDNSSELHIFKEEMKIGEIYGFKAVMATEHLKSLNIFDILKFIKIIDSLMKPISNIVHQ